MLFTALETVQIERLQDEKASKRTFTQVQGNHPCTAGPRPNPYRAKPCSPSLVISRASHEDTSATQKPGGSHHTMRRLKAEASKVSGVTPGEQGVCTRVDRM